LIGENEYSGMTQRVEIPLSKTKMMLLFIGSIAFVILGILFSTEPDSFISPMFRNRELIRIAGIASVVFFGLGAPFIFKKLFDKRAGLILDERGITDNSSALSIGVIEWQDIRGVETIQIASTKILMLLTDQPEKYMERASNGFSRKAMKANYKMYGSPLSITATSLQIKYEELERLIVEGIEKRSTPESNTINKQD
jgi:hypothetical protein